MQPARKTAGELHRFYKHHRLAWMVLFFCSLPAPKLTHPLAHTAAGLPARRDNNKDGWCDGTGSKIESDPECNGRDKHFF